MTHNKLKGAESATSSVPTGKNTHSEDLGHIGASFDAILAAYTTTIEANDATKPADALALNVDPSMLATELDNIAGAAPENGISVTAMVRTIHGRTPPATTQIGHTVFDADMANALIDAKARVATETDGFGGSVAATARVKSSGELGTGSK